MEPVLKPLVYQEPLRLVERHRERGEPVYIVSAALQEVVEAMAARAGLRRRARHDLRGGGRRLHGPLRSRLPRRAQGGRVRELAASRATTSPHRPRTPTATPTCRSSRPSATRSRSTPTAGCGASPPSAAGRCSGSTSRRSSRARLAIHPTADGDPARPRRGRRRLGRSAACSRLNADRGARLLRRRRRHALPPLPRRRGARQARPRPRAHPLARDAARPRARRAPEASSSRSPASSAGRAAARSAT